ncbi:hypothetical protein [Nocardia sp. NPDC051750]|uniref:hypothetical protein n=1 Tax=Nocardia sp. NPDC051750 TaxID=3364325 RepID=UPI003792703B
MFPRNSDKPTGWPENSIAASHDEKEAVKRWRNSHPSEKVLNQAALLRSWPSSRLGLTRYGPVQGGNAEIFDIGAHKSWTATRLAGGVATLGFSATLTGRKKKGSLTLNIGFGNGAAQSFNIKLDKQSMRAANSYVTAFNTLARQLESEGKPPA